MFDDWKEIRGVPELNALKRRSETVSDLRDDAVKILGASRLDGIRDSIFRHFNNQLHDLTLEATCRTLRDRGVQYLQRKRMKPTFDVAWEVMLNTTYPPTDARPKIKNLTDGKRLGFDSCFKIASRMRFEPATIVPKLASVRLAAITATLNEIAEKYLPNRIDQKFCESDVYFLLLVFQSDDFDRQDNHAHIRGVLANLHKMTKVHFKSDSIYGHEPFSTVPILQQKLACVDVFVVFFWACGTDVQLEDCDFDRSVGVPR